MKKLYGILMLAIVISFACFSQTEAESIGGISLGMSREEVVARYGNPAVVMNERQYEYYTGSYVGGVEAYPNGLAVYYKGGEVERVAMIRTQRYDRRFDNTGLGLNNTYADFSNTYPAFRRLSYDSRDKAYYGAFKTDTTGEYMWVHIVNGRFMGIELNNYNN